MVTIVEEGLAHVRRSTTRVRLTHNSPGRVTVRVTEELLELDQIIEIGIEIDSSTYVLNG